VSPHRDSQERETLSTVPTFDEHNEAAAAMCSDPAATYARIKEEILLGVLPPGTPLVEMSLADRYMVSRTPVREALRRLAHDGLVERGDRSMRVRQPTAEEIFELYEVREVLETAAARAAAERHSEVDVIRLQELIDQMKDIDLPVADRASFNRRFHSAMWKASHNSVLCQTLDRLYLNAVQHLNTTLIENERWESSMVEHENMMDAVLHGDADTAGRLVGEHLQVARNMRLRTRPLISHLLQR